MWIVTKIVFNQTLDELARKWFIIGNEHLIKDPRLFLLEYASTVNSICEQLLIHDGISFKVYGENIPLVILINTFGIKGVEGLLEDGAIEFLLWNPGVTYAIDDIPGIYPLQSMGKFTSSVHSDPEASIKSGLEFLRDPLPRRVRRHITRKALKRYKIPPEKISKDATDFGHKGYNDNLFQEFGLPKKKELIELNVQERKKLCNLATQCLQLTILSMYQYSTYNSFDLLKLNRSEFTSLKDANLVDDVIDTVFRIEKVPDFSKMISKGMLDIKDIPKFRKTKGSKQFRTWIDQVSHHTDRYDIAKEYIDAIIKPKSFSHTSYGKFLRVVSVTALGIGGGLLAGPIGAIPGAVIGGLTDVGIGLLDSYILDNILKGWSPRYYIDKQIKPLIKK